MTNKPSAISLRRLEVELQSLRYVGQVIKRLWGVNETAGDAGNRGPTKANPVPADEIKKLLIKSFSTNTKVYSFYSCQAGKCVTVSKEDQQRMKGRDRFQHQWISDTTLSYCEKTSYHWLLFQGRKGMFCIICRKHDTTNPQNKSKKFNTGPP